MLKGSGMSKKGIPRHYKPKVCVVPGCRAVFHPSTGNQLVCHDCRIKLGKGGRERFFAIRKKKGAGKINVRETRPRTGNA